jgi:hypothetical protein
MGLQWTAKPVIPARPVGQLNAWITVAVWAEEQVGARDVMCPAQATWAAWKRNHFCINFRQRPAPSRQRIAQTLDVIGHLAVKVLPIQNGIEMKSSHQGTS